jgi:hypothetical protein
MALTSDEQPIEPEVRVHSVRRRRSKRPTPLTPPPPNVRGWLIYIGLAVLVAALMLDGYLRHRPNQALLPTYSQATEVHSTVAEVADSLQVVVAWELTLADSTRRPDSVRIKVVAGNRPDSQISVQPSSQLSDTLYLPAPQAGQTLNGASCAAAEHPGLPLEESCTPWQFVRPSATIAQAAPNQATSPTQIVVQPAGLQVDPDVGGKCARWQQEHPNGSVWITVNQKAVPECTGPNHKPTVAQFCAFVVLPDGRRMKAANSANNPYCDELFEEWTRERYS